MLIFSGVVWSREEALAQILTVEAVDLPIEGAATSFQDPISYDAGLLLVFRNVLCYLFEYILFFCDCFFFFNWKSS